MATDTDDLRLQIEDALRKWTETQTRLARSSIAPSLGDIFVFVTTSADGIEWAVVLQHTDDPDLWFLIPYDQNPLVGTWDVATSEQSSAGPGTLRCGSGIWIHADDILFGERSGFLEPHDVRNAQVRLAAMVDESVRLNSSRAEVVDDPDYQEWIDEVTAASEQLEAKLRTPPAKISISDFSTNWAAAAGVRSARPTALAADTGGLGAAPQDAIATLPGLVIAGQLPGALIAVQEPGGIRLLYQPANQEAPPRVCIKGSGAASLVAWRQLPGNTSESVGLLDPSSLPAFILPNRLRTVLSVS